MDEMEQMMLQMEQMKELIVVLKWEWQEEAERFERAWSGQKEEMEKLRKELKRGKERGLKEV